MIKMFNSRVYLDNEEAILPYRENVELYSNSTIKHLRIPDETFRSVTIHNCRNLETISWENPQSSKEIRLLVLSGLPSLKSLNIMCEVSTFRIESVGKQSFSFDTRFDLMDAFFTDCDWLVALPTKISNSANILKCQNFSEIEFVNEKLHTLSILGCKKFKRFHRKIPVKVLQLRQGKQFEIDSLNLEHFPLLERLTLESNFSTPPIVYSTKLTDLEMSGSPKFLKELHVKNLTFTNCEFSVGSGLTRKNFPKLETLTLRRIDVDSIILNIQSLGITELEIFNCVWTSGFTRIMQDLQKLTITYVENFDGRIINAKQIPNLSYLEFSKVSLRNNDEQPNWTRNSDLSLMINRCDWFKLLPSGNYGDIEIVNCDNFKTLGLTIKCRKLRMEKLQQFKTFPRGSLPYLGKIENPSFEKVYNINKSSPNFRGILCGNEFILDNCPLIQSLPNGLTAKTISIRHLKLSPIIENVVIFKFFFIFNERVNDRYLVADFERLRDRYFNSTNIYYEEQLLRVDEVRNLFPKDVVPNIKGFLNELTN